MAGKMVKSAHSGSSGAGYFGAGEQAQGHVYHVPRWDGAAEGEAVVVSLGEVEIYENDFEIAIAEAMEKYGIEDLVKEGQTRWKAVMHYVGKRVFPDTKVLKDKQTVWLEGNRIPTNNNRYDYDILDIHQFTTFLKIKIQTHVLYCIIKASNQNHTKRDEFVSTAYYT